LLLELQELRFIDIFCLLTVALRERTRGERGRETERDRDRERQGETER
jgi:hypothetical protein